MYNPEEDIIPYELLEQALMISRVTPVYSVYYDKDTGNILSITNEPRTDLVNSFEVEYDVVKEFFNGKKFSSNYKVVFVDQTTPVIISKNDTDVNLIIIDEVPKVEHWDSMFTVENYPLLQQWGFQLRPDQQTILKQHNLNTAFEIFIVDKDYNNILVRSIKLFLKDLLENNRIYIKHEASKEADVENRIFVRKFFSTIGYQILYDTNS
jgi:hypothetical protein